MSLHHLKKLLKKWYLNNQDIKEIQSLEKIVKLNRNTFLNKSIQYRRIMSRPTSLKIISKNIEEDIIKKS